MPALPTPWNVFNLRASPYWQESLGGGDEAHPLTLFVGRTAELGELESVLYGAGASSSRQAVAGGAGVGKTTLVKELKARARDQSFLTVDAFAAMQPGDTAEALFGRVLNLVYETILANRPMTAGNPAMEAAQGLVRAGRLSTGGGGGLSLPGIGANASKAAALTTPRDLLLDGPRVMRDLMDVVRTSGAHGLLVHVNNLENLSEADAATASDLLSGLRDPMLMHPGLHVVVVGTTDAVQTVVNTHEQVRHTFSTLFVDPLGAPEVDRLLAERYRHLQLDPGRPVVAPVEDAAARTLHALFGGDLRGLLKALEDGVRPNISLAVRAGPDAAGAPVVRPLSEADIRPTLQQRYADQMAAQRERKRIAQLTAWGTRDPAAVHTQKSLEKLWRVSQGAVSAALAHLTREGYVRTRPRRGAGATEYALSGTSRLIFG